MVTVGLVFVVEKGGVVGEGSPDAGWLFTGPRPFP